MDLMEKIFELHLQGYGCSQVLAKLMLETLGEENDGFVKAMGGLVGGIGFSHSSCGCLTGGACALALVTGGAQSSPENHAVLEEFTRRFREEIAAPYDGTECMDITGGSRTNGLRICPELMAQTFELMTEILADNGLLPEE